MVSSTAEWGICAGGLLRMERYASVALNGARFNEMKCFSICLC